VAARASDVPGAIARLAETARSHSVRILSHDDPTTSIRSTYRAMGAHIAEFPTTFEVARDAIAHGDTTVFGAPNVLRGGSHIGFPGAADMAVKGYCSMLASDYYYPALLQAPFVLERKYGMAIAKAWSLVSAAPATAAGLSDRGRIIEGARADLVLVAATTGRPPRVVATIADGRLVYVTETERLAG
jgi:alpha-D-ribose 1-methylphosphonate 5-triphosphate diphosphatase